MKTVVDAVNEFKGEWPCDNRSAMIYCKISYAMYKEGDWESFVHDNFSDLNLSYWDSICTVKEFNQCVEEMSNLVPVKPAYTQEMADKGVMPSVGMECEIDGTGVAYVVVLTGDDEGDYILTPKKGDKYWQRSNIQYIKPIDTRTDEEKAIDEACEVINNDKDCTTWNMDINCSVAQKAVIVCMIKAGYKLEVQS